MSTPLKVAIASNCTVIASEDYRYCALEIFGDGFPINLTLTTMGDVCVIAGVDWMSRFGELIDFENQLVTIRNPSGGVLTIYGVGNRVGSAFCSSTRARQCLQHACIGYLAYVVDTMVEREKSVFDVPIVREFPDIFPEEFPSMPQQRQAKFMILLIPGVAPIVVALYHLAPPEMHELSLQL